MTMREEAEHLLQRAGGLLDVLRRYGEPVVTGSCSMDMMAWNDLDLYVVENDSIFAQWFALAHAVCDALQPGQGSKCSASRVNCSSAWKRRSPAHAGTSTSG